MPLFFCITNIFYKYSFNNFLFAGCQAALRKKLWRRTRSGAFASLVSYTESAKNVFPASPYPPVQYTYYRHTFFNFHILNIYQANLYKSKYTYCTGGIWAGWKNIFGALRAGDKRSDGYGTGSSPKFFPDSSISSLL